VLPDIRTVEAAATAEVGSTPAVERIGLVFASGAKSYPIIDFDYAIVKARQPNAQVAKISG
jgi:phosphate transport system substrate-binding protein